MHLKTGSLFRMRLRLPSSPRIKTTMSQTPLFPESYAPWLAHRLSGSVIETLATCGACAMAPENNSRLVGPRGQPLTVTRDPGPFDAKLKCCTYFPFVPNFGLGAMLRGGAGSGLMSVARTRIAAASATGLLLPQGLFASPEREALAASGEFGRDPAMLCPFFDSVSLGCSVWRNRPGVCTTYFCASDRGATGLEFWNDVETYLNHFEWTVANEVLFRLGFTNDDLDLAQHAMLTDEPGDERNWLVSRAWMEWSDRREDLLIACADRATEITPTELSALLGDEALELEESLRTRSAH
jgi:Fe-S-cluster containining protein